MSSTSYWLSFDPVKPWSLPGVGPVLLLAVAGLLVGLTLWTYAGVPRSGWRRIVILIFLRLTALVLACLALVRPSLAARDNQRERSTLLILLDASESMTIKDEFNSQSRWDAMRRTLTRCEPTLQQLRDEQNVDVQIYSFAENLGTYDPQGKADGKRTDYGVTLRTLYDKHGKGPFLGLLLCSDGLDNGTRYPTRDEVEKWRAADCPIYTFLVGSPNTSSEQRDIILTDLSPPPTVAIKNPLQVNAAVDVRGYKRPEVRAHLTYTQEISETATEVIVEQMEVLPDHKYRLEKEKGNLIDWTTTAPEKPGEIKVTFRIDPVDGDDIPANNEKSSYVTVTKEGLSVLYVDRLRPGEPRAIRAALHDPRINLTMLHRQDGPLSEAEEKLFRFEKPFDVIIIGDLSFQRLSGGNNEVAKRLHEQVSQKGTGILFLGGYQTFGNSDWQNVRFKDEKGADHSLAEIFPVDLPAAGQDEAPVQMLPTEKGLTYYLMRLSDKPGEDRQIWERLAGPQSRLRGMTKLGAPRPGAITLATAGDPANGVPLLVTKDFGAGRVLAFGADTTWRWRNLGIPDRAEGVPLHERFWKQVVLWLAKQEDAAGSVWVKPDGARLVSAGSDFGFAAGARGKNGEPLTDLTFKADVYSLKEVKREGNRITLKKQLLREGIPLSRRPDGSDHGLFDKTDLPGEYQIEVKAFAKGQAEPLKETGKLRFLIDQTTVELAVQAADPRTLEAMAGGPKRFLRLEQLPKLLEDLHNQPQPAGKARVTFRPDWGRDGSNWFLFGYLIVFVMLLGTEWFLRRSWGLV